MKHETLELVVARRAFKDTYTIGELFIDGVYFCDTLEPKVRDYAGGEKKVKGESAIPEGRYHVSEYLSPKRKMFVPQLDDVPMFGNVQIHIGNTKKDTEGCILVGKNSKKGCVMASKLTFDRLWEKLVAVWSVHAEVYITIINV